MRCLRTCPSSGQATIGYWHTNPMILACHSGAALGLTGVGLKPAGIDARLSCSYSKLCRSISTLKRMHLISASMVSPWRLLLSLTGMLRWFGLMIELTTAKLG